MPHNLSRVSSCELRSSNLPQFSVGRLCRVAPRCDTFFLSQKNFPSFSLSLFFLSTCGATFSHASDLKKHRETHKPRSQRKKWSCSHCAKEFLSKKGSAPHPAFVVLPPTLCRLRLHEAKHTGDGFRCHLCSKVFTTNSYLTEHLRIHSGERPFPCPKCNKRFAQRTNLTRHLQTHLPRNRRRIFPCLAKPCDKTFTSSFALHKHIEKHHPDLLTASNAQDLFKRKATIKTSDLIAQVARLPDSEDALAHRCSRPAPSLKILPSANQSPDLKPIPLAAAASAAAPTTTTNTKSTQSLAPTPLPPPSLLLRALSMEKNTVTCTVCSWTFNSLEQSKCSLCSTILPHAQSLPDLDSSESSVPSSPLSHFDDDDLSTACSQPSTGRDSPVGPELGFFRPAVAGMDTDDAHGEPLAPAVRNGEDGLLNLDFCFPSDSLSSPPQPPPPSGVVGGVIGGSTSWLDRTGVTSQVDWGFELWR
jgi:hypothetical protein